MVGRVGDSEPGGADLAGLSVGMFELDSVFECLWPLVGDSCFGGSTEAIILLLVESFIFSFCLDRRRVCATSGLTGILEVLVTLGLEWTLGLELNFSDVCLVTWSGRSGSSSSSRDAAAIKLFRSDRELRRFLLGFEGPASASGSPIVSNGNSIR